MLPILRLARRVGLVSALLLACGDRAAGAAAEAAVPGAASRGPATLDTARLAATYARAAALPKLRSLLVQWRDTLVAERYFGGATAARPANLKSASKSVISALVGVAVAEGELPAVTTPM